MGFLDQFKQQAPQPQQSANQLPMEMLASKMQSIKQAANGDATGFINYLSQTNPQFAQFAQSMQGKTPEQAFSEYGLDYSQFANLL